MNLDIIIPHYKEPENQILKALTMIDNQLGVDKSGIQITIVHDGAPDAYILDTGFLRSVISLPIKYFVTDKHLGPGYARQYAIDRTDKDYIMFCDSDDIFASPFVLKFFEDTLKTEPDLEVIMTGYLEEITNGDEYFYAQRDDDVSITTLHGKMYSRKFLHDNNITFPNYMISEDGAFNFKCVCHAKKAYFNDDVATYIWKYNPNSITRQNTSFPNAEVNIRVFGESIVGFEAFFDEIINNPKSQVNTNIILPFIESLYQRLNMIKQIPNLSDANLKDIDNTEEKLNQCRDKYKEYCTNATTKEFFKKK
jgi:glycosyltransferase involved in cell wall biosynthesis